MTAANHEQVQERVVGRWLPFLFVLLVSTALTLGLSALLGPWTLSGRNAPTYGLLALCAVVEGGLVGLTGVVAFRTMTKGSKSSGNNTLSALLFIWCILSYVLFCQFNINPNADIEFSRRIVGDFERFRTTTANDERIFQDRFNSLGVDHVFEFRDIRLSSEIQRRRNLIAEAKRLLREQITLRDRRMVEFSSTLSGYPENVIRRFQSEQQISAVASDRIVSLATRMYEEMDAALVLLQETRSHWQVAGNSIAFERQSDLIEFRSHIRAVELARQSYIEEVRQQLARREHATQTVERFRRETGLPPSTSAPATSSRTPGNPGPPRP